MHRVSPYLFRIFKQYWTQKYIMNMHGFGLCGIDQKKKVNVDKIRTVPKVSIKMNRAFKNPIFFFTKSRLMDFYVTSQYVYLCIFSAMSPSAYRTWITNESISLFKYYTVDMQAMHKRWIYYYDLIFKNKLYERHTSTHCLPLTMHEHQTLH